MKRKLLIAILVVASCFACVFGLSACGDDEQSGNGGNTEHGGSGGNSGGGIASLNGYEYTVKDGGYEITKVKDARITEAVIPDSVTSIAMDAFRGCTELKKLVIPDSVTYIGFEAFAGCDNIEEVSCPASAISNLPTKTKLKMVNITSGSISDNLLKDCTSLTSLMISSGVTSIGDNAFSGCASLTSVIVPDSVTTIGNSAFNGCPIETATIPALACGYIKNDKLKTVTIKSGESIGDWAFSGCSSLTSVSLPDSVTSIGDYAFRDCSSLTSITIPGGVTNIGDWAFSGCSSLTSITIPDSITSIGNSAFSDCSSLTNITIPDSVTSIGNSAFSGCTSLTIYCETASKPSGWDNDWNYYDRDYFYRPMSCPVVWGFKNNDEADDGYVYAVIDGIRYSLKNGIATVVRQPKNIITANIPAKVNYKNTEYSVTSISSYAFSDCSSLISVTIPDGVTSIDYDAFEGCSSLTEIKFKDIAGYCQINGLGNVDISKVYIGEQKLAEMTSITIPDNVTKIDSNAFEMCSRLTEIKFKDLSSYCQINIQINYSGSVFTSKVYIGGQKLTEMTSIVIPDGVTSIGFCEFKDCSSLAIVTIPDSVTSIDSFAFYGCGSLTSIAIPDSVTSIGDGAFEGCGSLMNITVSENNKTYKSIDGDMYSKDGKTLILYAAGKTQTSFTIPDEVTSIDGYAFSGGCSSLTSITIPVGVFSLGRYHADDDALCVCSSLTDIYFKGTKVQWDAIEKGHYWYYYSYTVHCTDGDIEKYI